MKGFCLNSFYSALFFAGNVAIAIYAGRQRNWWWMALSIFCAIVFAFGMVGGPL